ncbi:hypothetical protein CN611_14185 [Bacillus wiedmannii]|uniref:Uncharacterized protein n=1 Tax=Bacillus wiedmannii TaxID=1890302 RepID=A0A2A8BNA0_9BACI|nr:hypothetical protein CN611_14185 [Bacillus wiedmannii]
MLLKKSNNFEVFELDTRYTFGKRIEACCTNMNVICTFKVFNITLPRFNHRLIYL